MTSEVGVKATETYSSPPAKGEGPYRLRGPLGQAEETEPPGGPCGPGVCSRRQVRLLYPGF